MPPTRPSCSTVPRFSGSEVPLPLGNAIGLPWLRDWAETSSWSFKQHSWVLWVTVTSPHWAKLYHVTHATPNLWSWFQGQTQFLVNLVLQEHPFYWVFTCFWISLHFVFALWEQWASSLSFLPSQLLFRWLIPIQWALHEQYLGVQSSVPRIMPLSPNCCVLLQFSLTVQSDSSF